MKTMSYAEFKEAMSKYNSTEYGRKNPIKGVIVITVESFNKVYTLESRSYAVSSVNKGFSDNTISKSIFGCSLDETDMGVGLENYLKDENGGKNGWEVDYCYFVSHK